MASAAASGSASGTLLRPGANCWRLARASRGAFLIDAADYFGALRSALVQARRSVLILGWDIDSRLRLVGAAPPEDGLPEPLRDLLNALVERRSGLRVHVLSWDFSMIYAMEREWLSAYRLGWLTDERVEFRLDGRHPLGASHHQKLVVIDDRLAFVGGIDLSKWRWDTSEHAPDDSRRVDAEGSPYPPFHDLQWMVEGEVAGALGELARERWARATGAELPPCDEDLPSPWPEQVTPDFKDRPIAVSRTDPELPGGEAREVERLYLDAIAAARETIYVENQYLTSAVVADALVRRLEGDDAPEMVIVLPLRTGGWLEQHTMDVLRARVLRRLRSADRHDRLRVYYPYLPGLEPDACLGLHSKMMIVDERMVRFGSANLSNRSMGLDTECDLALEESGEEGSDPEGPAGQLLHRLLSEHLDQTPERVAQARSEAGSLIRAIERLRGDGRSLRPLDGEVDEELDRLVPEAAVLDPEEPVLPEILTDRVFPDSAGAGQGRRTLLLGAAVLAVLIGLGLAWRYTALGDWMDPQVLQSYAVHLQRGLLGPVIILAVYVVWGLVAAPLTPLVVASALIFGALPGFLYSVAGSTLSALVTYGVGHLLGRRAVRRLTGSRLDRLSRRLARNGLLAVITVRIVPVAPFTVINLAAGASHIRLRDYALGTVLGFIPGMAAVCIFADRLAAMVQDPGWKPFAVLAAVGAVLVGGGLLLRYWLRRRTRILDRKAQE